MTNSSDSYLDSLGVGFRDALDVVSARLALDMYQCERDEPGSSLKLSTWLSALAEAKAQGKALLRNQEKDIADGTFDGFTPEQQARIAAAPRKARKELRRQARKANTPLRNQWMNSIMDMESQLKRIGAQRPDVQRTQLAALYQNFVVPHSQLMLNRDVPRSAIVSPDWNAVTGKLQLTSSEQTVTNLDTAFSHGRFAVTPESDYPMANISGRMGNTDVIAHAELKSDLDTPEARKIMAELAERLRDPRLGLGPRVQQTIQALMSFWITRRNADGNVVVDIAQLAAALGYVRGEHGYSSETYQNIREYVSAASRTNLRAMFPESPMRPRIEERAFSFTYFDTADGATNDRPSKGWLALGFRPGSYLAGATERVGALLKGYDRDLNRLHPVKERGELLLGKYLENQWRFNWNKTPGQVRRTMRELLTNGMGLSEETVMRPAMKTLTMLSDALDRLEEMGTVKYWEADDRWQSVTDYLEPQGVRRSDRRMNPRLWQSALDACIDIEAGKQYHAHYINHGLTYQGTAKVAAPDSALLALKDYMARTDRSQAMIAKDLGVSKSLLSQLLSRDRTITPAVAEKIDRLVNQGTTLPLPLLEPPK
jgi:hypothetical protein